MDTNLTLPSGPVTPHQEPCCHDACCTAGPALPAANNQDRAALIRRAFRLEYTTVAWMAVEAIVAIWAGMQAASVCLLAFGIDSLIEIASAGVLIWRLTTELRRGQAFAEKAERAASRAAGGLLFALAVYVVIAAGWKLWTQTGEAFSWPGLAVTLLAMPIMYVLARQKISVAKALGSRAMRADAMESVTCGWLSLVVVAGFVAQGLTGAWWVDSVTSLGIVWFLVKEGREAWSGEDCCQV
ncbi:MAG: cation transporter [Proteobacteria bacterium]|nr:cation transporter [Pseudomonadota bacterium]